MSLFETKNPWLFAHSLRLIASQFLHAFRSDSNPDSTTHLNGLCETSAGVR